MGTSSYTNIPTILKYGLDCEPKSILDIGCGFGKYGALFREYTDIWKGRTYTDKWITEIIGIEAFPKYIHQAHKYYYNNIIIGDIESLLFSNKINKKFDLILWLDGPEHTQKEKGTKILKYLYDIVCNKRIIISHPNITDPKIALSQGCANNNPFERHLSIWGPNDFKSYNPINNGIGSIVVLNKQ